MNIQFNNLQMIERALQELAARGQNMRPVFLEIGENLTESTKHRFDTLTAPMGESWAGNSPKTIERKGHAIPLTGKTGNLRKTIHYNFLGERGIEIGSPMNYARVQQQGGVSHWHEYDEIWVIPPRPFLGISNQDREDVLRLISSYLLPAS